MASIKVKYRPSTASGKEGSIYYQIIHGRIVRQIKTEYRLFDTEVGQRYFFRENHAGNRREQEKLSS